MGSTVLVTGASGFVGLNLLHVLTSLGHRVIGLDDRALPRMAASSLADLGREVPIELVDIRDTGRVGDVLEQYRPDLVIHAAAVTAGLDRERAAARVVIDVNVVGTQSVLDACTRAGVRRLLHVSSGAVYGPAAFGTEPVDETTPVTPSGYYGITKLAAEQVARRHADLHGLDVVVGRLSALFGPWEHPTGIRDFMSPMLQMVRAARDGEAIAIVADRPRNWAYAPDAARALVSLALTPEPKHRCYNVCPETTTTARAFLDRLTAVHQGLDASIVDRLEDASINFDADPRQERAVVSAQRLAGELDRTPWSSPETAFDAYIAWARAHPSWL